MRRVAGGLPQLDGGSGAVLVWVPDPLKSGAVGNGDHCSRSVMVSFGPPVTGIAGEVGRNGEVQAKAELPERASVVVLWWDCGRSDVDFATRDAAVF